LVLIGHITVSSQTKLIFLDLDGVLVPEKKFTEKTTQFFSPEDYLKFDVDCLLKFENILRRYPDVLVVISSSWKEIFKFAVVRGLFSSDIMNRVLGFTPFLNSKIVHDFEYLRHQEVLEYLNQNNAVNTPWIAIDDIREHYPPDVRIVVTNAYSGFDESAAIALDSYLQKL
jgi:hypothetical protein